MWNRWAGEARFATADRQRPRPYLKGLDGLTS
jgi:hypothetical protein